MEADHIYDSSTSDSSEEEDDDAKELTEDVEKTFFKTLSYIKKKDPKIYDENIKFFNENSHEETGKIKNLKKSEEPLNLRAYERKLIVDRGGELSDEEQVIDDEERPHSPTYIEEQKLMRESFKKVLKEESDDEDDSWGGLFHKRDKTAQEIKKEDKDYREWLKGQTNELSDKKVEDDLKFLHDYWTDPKLEQEEQFLRDYILNKRFLEKEDEPEVDMDGLLEEEKELEQQTEFEHKYNYRFEEPDQEFIKRYPRVMANSIRTKDERRKEKRDEIKDRKLKEKEKKKEEIKHKKKLKKQEIEAKLEELKKLTGNDQLAFESQLNADFDQDEYDRVMKRLFDEEFYSKQDPNFNPNDVDEEYENAMEEDEFEYDEDMNNDYDVEMDHDYDDINCEDPNFNMDCDFDPSKIPKKKKKEGKGRRARDKHKRTTVSEAVSREKPTFDPTEHCSFQDYLDQYYSIDCEDFIGDVPCRFKYKRVTPNSYGLSVEEILAADDKELERWCPIKKVHKIGSEYKEKNDAKMYSKRAKNEDVKKKILPSLYSINHEDDSQKVSTIRNEKESFNTINVKDELKEKQNHKIISYKNEEHQETIHESTKPTDIQGEILEKIKVRKKKSKNKICNSTVIKSNDGNIDQSDENKEYNSSKIVSNCSTETKSLQYNTKINETNKMFKSKKRKNKELNLENEKHKKIKISNETITEVESCENAPMKKKRSPKPENNMNSNINGLDLKKKDGKSRRQRKNEKARLLKDKLKDKAPDKKTFKVANKFEKKFTSKNSFKIKKNVNKAVEDISDSRLKAYGIKPKAFKGKLRYGTNFNSKESQ
uniref:Protein KRI1 homolog n=1 Tax=Clastoptera arizonana TaxID=38151 RepID=A0A1B6CBR8_9HEMI